MMIEPDYFSSGDIPVFRPSMEEFADFEKYMKSINKYGMQSGIVKVVPPEEWVKALPRITEKQLQSIKIKNPIVQHISGNNGVFGQQNVEKQRTFNIVQWKSLSEETNYQPPAPRGKVRKSVDKYSAMENKKILANKNHNDESLFKNFKYNIDTSEFTEERCEQLEKVYWKSLMYADPMYGADILGSIFDDTVKTWNVAHLPNALDFMDQKLPGVNDAYLYAGLWKATFSWHLEDQDLYSINYLHFGAPKQWYSIPQSYKDKFDRVMQETFPQEYAHCSDFLRHKTFLVSPAYLEARGVKVNKIVHYEQEFMITYPYGYHAGMNFGYNIAESVNFAIEEWFDYGLKTSKCLCINDSVGIDIPKLIRRYKGQPEPKQQTKLSLNEEKTIIEDSDSSSNIIEIIAGKDLPERTKKKLQKEKQIKLVKQEKIRPRCSLCPNILSIRQLKHESFKLLPTFETFQNSKKKSYCHKICAKSIPETTIVYDVDRGEYVDDIDKIPKARHNLKCTYCHEKSGACFQCSYGNCIRSFHATCALPAGVFFQRDNVHYCKIHRSKFDESPLYLKMLNVGDTLQAKFDDFFAGVILANNKSEKSFNIELYPVPEKLSDRLEIEVPYSAVKTQGQRFPKSLKKLKPIHIDVSDDEEEKIITVDLKDKLRYSSEVEEFHGTKWILEKLKVIESEKSYSTEHPLWYYKPLKSSETIARYSDDILLDEPNDPHSLKRKLRQKYCAQKRMKSASLSPPTKVVLSTLNNTLSPIPRTIIPQQIPFNSKIPIIANANTQTFVHIQPNPSV